MNYVYSLNNHDYYEKEDIIKMLNQTNDFKKVYRGEKINFTHKDFISGSMIVDSICNLAYDVADDYSENYINSIENKDVEEGLEKVILDYLNENVPQPSFYTITHIVAMTIEEFHADLESKYPEKEL